MCPCSHYCQEETEQRSEDVVITQLFAEVAENGWAPVERLIGYIRSVLPAPPSSVDSEDVYESDGSVR